MYARANLPWPTDMSLADFRNPVFADPRLVSGPRLPSSSTQRNFIWKPETPQTTRNLPVEES